LAPEWSEIQRASMAKGAYGLDRMAAGRRRGELRTLAPGLVGYLASFAALVGTTEIPDTCEELAGFLRRYGEWSELRFADRVEDKRRRRALG